MFLLDTNILSELVKKKPNPNLLSRLSSLPIHTLFTSIICLMELRYGSALRSDFDSFWSKIVGQVISQVQVISLGPEEGLIAGDLLARLKKKGQSIGLEDILISSTAITHNLVLVTANIKHFSKIDGLTVENWLVV
ncbi:MAG: PIN domain-containing protein [Deltaproteobacteria bacterium]|nr:PIN domain-containing protein [Deltaproteobacteria bacterium]